MNQLEALKKYTVVVEDTGDLDAIARHKPRDATTNPSLLLKAVSAPDYQPMVQDALSYAKSQSGDLETKLDRCIEKLFVDAGLAILKIVPRRVSTEVPARLSFDTQATLATARRLIALYEEAGQTRQRVLIKIASTWEGIKAAEILVKEGIHCNLTLLFSFAQAVACAQARVQLISPFVGRIYDWACAHRKVQDIPIAEDPGVASVRAIYQYYKKFDYATEIMGASFRKREQIVALAGCDLLTISPELIQQLQECQEPLERALDPQAAKACELEQLDLDEKEFRWLHNSDAMAVEKLAEGIRKFDQDMNSLRDQLRGRLN